MDAPYTTFPNYKSHYKTSIELKITIREHGSNSLSPVAVAAAAEVTAVRIEMEPPCAVGKLLVERRRPVETQVGIEHIVPPITCSGQKDAVAV